MKIALALVVVFLGSMVTEARDEVSLLVSPRVAAAPATARINVIVEPDSRNRMLILEAESGYFYTSSSVQLEGSNSGRLHPFTFVELPPGNYELMARVLRSDGGEKRAVLDYLVTP